MFHVMSCSKYRLKTLRIVDLGECTVQRVIDQQMGECLLCGPCSQVEIGSRNGWWKSHGEGFPTAEEAAEAAWKLIDECPDEFERHGLPDRQRDFCSCCNAELIGDARHYSEDNSCFCWACCPVNAS